MRDIPTKTDGVSTLPAAEFNDITNELESLITKTGQSLTSTNLDQLNIATSIYAAKGQFYVDSGGANTYVLSTLGNMKAPNAYANGMLVRFRPAVTNTSASTVNVASLGAKNIVQADGSSVLTASMLPADRDVTLVYDGTSFRLVHVSSVSSVSLATSGSNSHLCHGRLGLHATDAYYTSDITAATTLYYIPTAGSSISFYNGATWDILNFTTASIAIPATTNTNYDVFAYNNSGTIALELTAWTNDTTRATALTEVNGVYVKSGATTRRFLGTIRTTGVSGQCEDSLKRRFVYNHYNRRYKPFNALIPTASWTYSSTTWRAVNANTTVGEGRVELVVGHPGGIYAYFMASADQDHTGSSYVNIAVGVDITNNYTFPGNFGTSDSSEGAQNTGVYDFYLTAGYHFVQQVERANGATGIMTNSWLSGHSDF